jgi:glycosyltransferase involved in cell wall biosynthesis
LKRAGVLLFPSEREGLALSVIEALGMGLPVIGQSKTSMPELITDGVNGHLIDLSDQDGWSNALLSTLGVGPDSRLFVSADIRKATMDRFAWSSIGQRYGEIYRAMFCR